MHCLNSIGLLINKVYTLHSKVKLYCIQAAVTNLYPPSTHHYNQRHPQKLV